MKIPSTGKQKYSKDRLTSSKKKKCGSKERASFFTFQNGKKKSSFSEGKYCQWPQMPKLKQPFGLAVQKDKKDKGHFKCFYPSA